MKVERGNRYLSRGCDDQLLSRERGRERKPPNEAINPPVKTISRAGPRAAYQLIRIIDRPFSCSRFSMYLCSLEHREQSDFKNKAPLLSLKNLYRC